MRLRSFALAAAQGTSFAAALVSLPLAAHAQLVVGKAQAARARDARIVVMREGERSVITLSAKVDPKAERVAWLFPVTGGPAPTEASLGATALEEKVVRAIASVSGPRVAEYWEQDPCALHTAVGPGPSKDPGTSEADDKPAPKRDAAAGAPVVSVLAGSAEAASKALKEKGFDLSSTTKKALGAYLDDGGSIVVAELSTSSLKDGVLPPVRFAVDQRTLTLPSRLAGADKGTTLDVFVLASGVRFEAEGLPNLAIPTNLDVKPEVKAALGSFYEALRANTAKKAPGAIVTEYAWRATGCDLCRSPLGKAELASVGTGLLPSAAAGKQGEVLIHAESVTNEPGGPAELRSALEACYEKALSEKPGLTGTLALEVVVTGEDVTAVTAKERVDASFDACAIAATTDADLARSGTLRIELSPMSRELLGGFVLTRLRARYDAAPEKDLVLRPARALEGGREEGPDGKPAKKVYWAETGNNFQARYVVRHPWKGEVTCSKPRRGFWGGPPAGEKPSPSGNATISKLDSVIVGGLPELASFEIAYQPPVPPPPKPAPTPVDSGAVDPAAVPVPGSAAVPPIAPPVDDGCGCRAVGARAHGSVAGALVAALLMVVRRRRRSAPTRSPQ
jgi:hypothetical protein